MTLFQIISILKQIALVQPNVRTATDGSIYDKLNTNPSVEYDVVHIQQTTHQSDEVADTYGFNIFYVSRLEDSLEDNRLQIQSIGKEVLDNILRTFCENWNIDFPIITYYPFTQRFNDLCAGVYCNVRIIVPKDLLCADDYIDEVVPSEKDIRLENVSVTITENGTRVIEPSAGFDGIGMITIYTDVPNAGRLEYKEVEYTENGEYTIVPSSGYDGISEVAVTVDVPATGDRYDEGYEDGERDQKAKLTSTSFTQNDTYSRPDGWSSVTVNVDDRYEEGYEDGEAAQKAKLVSTSFTANNTYTRVDGWSSVTVNVPATTAYTDQDLIANLQGDYFVIPSGTTHLRDFAFYETCFSSITIPNTVTTIGDNAFANNTCLKSIVIPDSVQSLGSNAFATCTNLQTAILGNGFAQLQTNTFYNCRSLTGITIPSGITEIGSYCFGNCSGLTEMTFEGLVPPTLSNTSGNRASLGQTAYTFPIYVPCQSLEAYKTAFGEYYAPRIQCIPGPTPPTPPSNCNELDFVYSTSTANETVTLFTGEAQMDSAHFNAFYEGLVKIEVDGVLQDKDSTHIGSRQGDVQYYWHTFASAGLHTVKYYVTKNEVTITSQYDSYPGYDVLSQLFSYDPSVSASVLTLVDANIGEGYVNVHFGAFQHNRHLTALTIPASVTGVGDYICEGCTNLPAVTVKATTPPAMLDQSGSHLLFHNSGIQNIYVPAASVEAYKAAAGWRDYANIITAITS